MLFRYLLAPLLALSHVGATMTARSEPSVCGPVGHFSAILPIMGWLDCEINLAKANMSAVMASPSESSNAQMNETIFDISVKMLMASKNVRELNRTLIETYGLSSDGLRLLSPEEIGPAAAPCFQNMVSLETMIRDHILSKRKNHRPRDVGTALFLSGKEYVYGYSASLIAGSKDYVSFASAVNLTGELHIQGGASVLNVQLNNVQLGLYYGEWSHAASIPENQIKGLNSSLSAP
ncbi:hypothetical protein RhiXN_01337 [Rhizoctonia solani]|uniref:Uncharacterized protein n=1 Tax=Rhizoctonia solani TaxID=456999 RepID=A0A8H8T3D2_9AGAM|nr:uncharacterized protein RhiXN_01337 [Rhizoctonia solani]QRW26742.1 hypothetical protein RhiXN_01337 [Rhizoctonia solani]